jgi:hypothetical protein
MLDENLPTFYAKPSSDNPLERTLFLSQNGSELQPDYVLRRPAPSLPASKNRYAIALYDSYNPDVLYAEVLVEPEWSQPTLSQAEIRAQGGVPAQPVPVIPHSFTIQLYNPDQQVTIRQIPGSWNSSAHWEFEMPQNSFRLPSASALDRSQSDPTIAATTPKVAFKWKRDGKLTKDISCYLVGKPTIEGRKNKEPDIPVAMYKGDKNLTIYQPNIHRVEVEDTKGLEVVFILGSVVIKDIFFNADRETFNISSSTPPAARIRRKSSGPLTSTKPKIVSPGRPHGRTSPTMSGGIMTSPVTQSQQQQFSGRKASPSDPQTQWEIDAETARLKALVLAEENERERAEREEEERLKKMLQDEERERQRREAEVAAETERLRKQYGITGQLVGQPQNQFLEVPSLPPRPMPQSQSAPHSVQPPVQRPVSTPGNTYSYTGNNSTWAAPGSRPQQNAHLQAPPNGGSSSSGFFGLGGRTNKVQKKKSVFF